MKWMDDSRSQNHFAEKRSDTFNANLIFIKKALSDLSVPGPFNIKLV